MAATSPATSGSDAGPRAIDAVIAAVLLRIEEGSPAGIRAATEALEHVLTARAAHEEVLMSLFSYPLAEGHAAAHALLLSEVRRFLRRVVGVDATRERRRTAVREITTRFHAHVAAHDLGLAAFLRRSRAT